MKKNILLVLIIFAMLLVIAALVINGLGLVMSNVNKGCLKVMVDFGKLCSHLCTELSVKV